MREVLERGTQVRAGLDSEVGGDGAALLQNEPGGLQPTLCG